MASMIFVSRKDFVESGLLNTSVLDISYHRREISQDNVRFLLARQRVDAEGHAYSGIRVFGGTMYLDPNCGRKGIILYQVRNSAFRISGCFRFKFHALRTSYDRSFFIPRSLQEMFAPDTKHIFGVVNPLIADRISEPFEIHFVSLRGIQASVKVRIKLKSGILYLETLRRIPNERRWISFDVCCWSPYFQVMLNVPMFFE